MACKTRNNGISFLAFENAPCSSKLLDKNNTFIDQYGKLAHVQSITKDLYSFMIKSLKKNKDRLEELRNVSKCRHITDDLYCISLENIQNLIIADFNEFIDDCYLQFLIHVLDHNNTDNLKLSPLKSKVRLNDISETEGMGYNDHWLTIQQIISGLWKDFKFLAFKEKFIEIRKCVDYEGVPEQIEMIYKHVIIRNCVQHHSGQLDPTSLKQIGKRCISVLSDDKNEIEIKEWDRVYLTYTELSYFIIKLIQFLDDFEKHINIRTRSRHFMFINRSATDNDVLPI